MPSSLLTLTTPPPDPLPLYTRDPETSSIRSAAPSYTSAAPSYHSTRPHPAHRSTIALPASHYAPGFRAPTAGTISNVENHRFEISEWSAVNTGHHARQYQNVALRRATMASASEEVNALAAAVLGQPGSSVLSPVPESAVGTTPQRDIPGDEEDELERLLRGADGGGGRGEPFSPQEDPDLVGAEAAARARATRLYMKRCGDEEALRQDGKMWDFMLAQMGDWRERERSWEKFRREVGRSRVLGRRMGLGKSGGVSG